MNEFDLLAVVTGFLTIALVLWFGWQNRPGSAAEVSRTIVDAAETAEVLVSAAEQLWLSGKLPKEGRFPYVLNRLVAEFPAINQQQLEATIEAAVYWLKVSSEHR